MGVSRYLPLHHLLGESVDQKLTGEFESLVGSCEASHASRKSVDHAFPYIQASIGSFRDRALNKANGIVEQNLVVTDMYTDRGQALEIGVERRGERICRIMAVQIRTHQIGRLRLSKVGVGNGARRPAFSGKGKIRHGRECHSAHESFAGAVTVSRDMREQPKRQGAAS